MIRKGMVLLDITSKPKSTRSFECEIVSLESTERSIKYKFEPLLIINNIRQCCKIRKLNIEENASALNENKHSKNKPLTLTPSISDSDDPFDSFSTFGAKRNVGIESTINSSHIGTTSFVSESTNLNKNTLNQNSKPHYFKDYKKNSDASDKDISYKSKVTKANDGFVISNTKKVIVNFEFKNFPEYVETNTHVIINEPYMKAIGFIRKLKT